MDRHDWLAEQFGAHRDHLRAVAYRMLGSLSESDDAVQASWRKLSGSDTSAIELVAERLGAVVSFAHFEHLCYFF